MKSAAPKRPASNRIRRHLGEILDACEEAKRAEALYQACREEDAQDVWDARADAYQMAKAKVASHYAVIAEVCTAARDAMFTPSTHRPSSVQKTGEHKHGGKDSGGDHHS